MKNQGLGFEIPYRDGALPRKYLPDFIVQLETGAAEPLHLILETKGYRGKDAQAKADTRGVPPEDVGGPPGYERFLEAWRHPNHEQHKAMRTWAGRSFDPEAFDREKTQKAIKSALRRCKGDYRFRLEA